MRCIISFIKVVKCQDIFFKNKIKTKTSAQEEDLAPQDQHQKSKDYISGVGRQLCLHY